MTDYHHNAGNLPDYVKKSCKNMKIWKKVSVIVFDHASTMGTMCEQMNKDFHECFNHFLNLVCELFFECFKKSECLIFISDDYWKESLIRFVVDLMQHQKKLNL